MPSLSTADNPKQVVTTPILGAAGRDLVSCPAEKKLEEKFVRRNCGLFLVLIKIFPYREEFEYENRNAAFFNRCHSEDRSAITQMTITPFKITP